MAVFLVVTRPDKPEVIKEIAVTRKLVLGNSVYCDLVLDDKMVASMQCEVIQAKSGHIVVKNIDAKREILLNQVRFKKSAIKPDDELKIGPFVVKIDHEKLTQEELAVLNSEYEEFV